jgi:hypothetical protein
MTGTLRVPRSRGALSGTLLALLGLWGGLIPFVGPYFDFAYTPDSAWVSTSGRLWLEVLPAAATVLGGLILLSSANRAIAMFGAWVAALGGAWFVVGGPVSTLWTAKHVNAAGAPVGSVGRQVAEQLAFFTGLGVVITFFAALALGRLAVVGVRDAALTEPQVEEYAPEPYPTAPAGPPPVMGRYARPSGPDTTPLPKPRHEVPPGPADAPPPLPRRRPRQESAAPTDQKVAGHPTGDR